MRTEVSFHFEVHMRRAFMAALAMSLVCGFFNHPASAHERADSSIQLGPRPFFLVQGMDPGPLKSKLLGCQNGPFHRTDFSIAHRGAPLQLPEHTKEAYEAGARMGAGIVECD